MLQNLEITFSNLMDYSKLQKMYLELHILKVY